MAWLGVAAKYLLALVSMSTAGSRRRDECARRRLVGHCQTAQWWWCDGTPRRRRSGEQGILVDGATRSEVGDGEPARRTRHLAGQLDRGRRSRKEGSGKEAATTTATAAASRRRRGWRRVGHRRAPAEVHRHRPCDADGHVGSGFSSGDGPDGDVECRRPHLHHRQQRHSRRRLARSFPLGTLSRGAAADNVCLHQLRRLHAHLRRCRWQRRRRRRRWRRRARVPGGSC